MSQNINLRIIPAEEKSDVSKLNYKKKFPSHQSAEKEVGNILSSLHYRGYLLAEADTIYSDSTSLTAVIATNELYRSARLGLGNLDPTVASKLGISEKLYFNKPFRYGEVARAIEKIIVHYENNGYPFASVRIDSLNASQGELTGKFMVSRNKLFKIDSIIVNGSANINKRFLYRYLSLKEGMAYDESAISAISSRIRQLPFLTEKMPPVVRLTERTNRLLLFLDKKNASRFDGIIGLLPDADSKKTIITGDVKLKLLNSVFRNGETIDLEWRRLRSQTQDFAGKLIYPYLFGSPFGSDYELKIYRRDTTFIDINNNIGLQYYIGGLNNLRIFYKQRNSNLISTSGYDFITTLPGYADITTRSYGAGVFFEKLDYRFNPKKGISLNISGQTGNRQIRQNPDVNELAYKDLLLRSLQYQFEGNVNIYVNIYRSHVLRFAAQGASIFGNSTVFVNELFRIGGLKTLRGFDEESIFTSSYVIPTLEYRFLFSENSNILLFAEGALYENNSNNTYVRDNPVSIGAGINFETKAGILSLNYALGNQFGNGFDLRNGKIHFGLTALF